MIEFKPCEVKGCDTQVPQTGMRPSQNLCVTHWIARKPDEFKSWMGERDK